MKSFLKLKETEKVAQTVKPMELVQAYNYYRVTCIWTRIHEGKWMRIHVDPGPGST